jgi:DinB superfamily
MSIVLITRPEPDEAASFYHGYIAKVPDRPLAEQLTDQLREVEQLFETVTDRDSLARYAEGKWSVKEILGHLADTERIFTYRMLRIARGDSTPLPGFDENAYVLAGKFDDRPLPMLLAELRAIRLSTIALVDGLPAESWGRWGESNGNPITARALAYIIVGHLAHHVGVLRDRYGLTSAMWSPQPA